VQFATARVEEMDMRSANRRQVCLGHRHRLDFLERFEFIERFELIGWGWVRGKRGSGKCSERGYRKRGKRFASHFSASIAKGTQTGI
jgi:hypothetical protein